MYRFGFTSEGPLLLDWDTVIRNYISIKRNIFCSFFFLSETPGNEGLYWSQNPFPKLLVGNMEMSINILFS